MKSFKKFIVEKKNTDDMLNDISSLFGTSIERKIWDWYMANMYDGKYFTSELDIRDYFDEMQEKTEETPFLIHRITHSQFRLCVGPFTIREPLLTFLPGK